MFFTIIKILNLVRWIVALVEPELKEKDGIEEDGANRQDELDKIECTRIKERITEEDALDGRLHQRKRSTCKVKADVGKGPADATLAPPVQVDLGKVFEESDGGLAVAHHEEYISIVWKCTMEDLDTPVSKDCEIAATQEDDPE